MTVAARIPNSVPRTRQQLVAMRGTTLGRPVEISRYNVLLMYQLGYGPTAIAREMGIERKSVYNILNQRRALRGKVYKNDDVG